MSTAIRERAGRALGVVTSVLVLTSVSLVGLSATVSAAPQPSADITVSCTYKQVDGNYVSQAKYQVDAAYKGRWVGFHLTVSFDDVPKASVSIPKWDSRAMWPSSSTPDRRTSVSSEASTSAHIAVEILSKKGVPVLPAFTESAGCTAEPAA